MDVLSEYLCCKHFNPCRPTQIWHRQGILNIRTFFSHLNFLSVCHQYLGSQCLSFINVCLPLIFLVVTGKFFVRIIGKFPFYKKRISEIFLSFHFYDPSRGF